MESEQAVAGSMCVRPCIRFRLPAHKYPQQCSSSGLGTLLSIGSGAPQRIRHGLVVLPAGSLLCDAGASGNGA